MKKFPRANLPEILSPIYFDFHWTQKKLWALALPKIRMQISELEWAFAYPILASEPPEKIYNLTPNSLLLQTEKYPDHVKRMAKADTSFPIHVMLWRDRWLVMDGFHRLLKLKLQGESYVEACQVPESAIEKISPDEGTDLAFLALELAKRDKE
ncbi:MAG: hypothetical protein ACXWQO_18190 [Bdellovibrionota bacterium]